MSGLTGSTSTIPTSFPSVSAPAAGLSGVKRRFVYRRLIRPPDAVLTFGCDVAQARSFPTAGEHRAKEKTSMSTSSTGSSGLAPTQGELNTINSLVEAKEEPKGEAPAEAPSNGNTWASNLWTDGMDATAAISSERAAARFIFFTNSLTAHINPKMHRSCPNSKGLGRGKNHISNESFPWSNNTMVARRDHDGSAPDLHFTHQLFMLRSRRVRDRLKVGIVQRDSSVRSVDLLVDTGGTISIAGALCQGLFHLDDIYSVRPVKVETASGVMSLEYAWKGLLKLGDAPIQVTLLLAPLYQGGIIFGTEVQEDLEVNINIARGYRTILFGCLGVKATTNLVDGSVNLMSDVRDRSVIVCTRFRPHDTDSTHYLTLDSTDTDIILPKTDDFKSKRARIDKDPPTHPDTKVVAVTPVPRPHIGSTWHVVLKSLWERCLAHHPVLAMPEGRGPQVRQVARIPVKDGPPVSVQNYRREMVEGDFIHRKVGELLEKDVIKPTVSEWNSPILVVPKQGDEKWRLVIDDRG